MNTEERDHNIMANTDSFNKFLTDLRDMIDAHLSGVADAVVAEPKKSSAKPSAKVDKEEVVEEATDREAELMKTNIRTLRKMAIELGFDEDEVADADKETLVESIIEEGGDTTTDADADTDEDDETEDVEDVEDAEDAEDDDDADTDEDDEADVEDAEDAEDDAEEDEEEEDEDDEEEDDEEEDDEEAEGYTREDLEGLTLAALKKIAKEEFEETTASLKGLDTDDIIDLILGEGDEEEEEDEDEEEGLTEEDLEAMSLAEVKAVAKDNGVAVKAGMKKADIIEAIFA